jgi:predicted amino acid-binding ACT domain protein
MEVQVQQHNQQLTQELLNMETPVDLVENLVEAVEVQEMLEKMEVHQFLVQEELVA